LEASSRHNLIKILICRAIKESNKSSDLINFLASQWIISKLEHCAMRWIYGWLGEYLLVPLKEPVGLGDKREEREIFYMHVVG